MIKSKSQFLFNAIASIYNLFYAYQKKQFLAIVQNPDVSHVLKTKTSILDVGSGTGALASVFHDLGYQVTGVDFASNMVKTAQANPKHKHISFMQGNILDGLPFEDNSFDLVIASFVAHGMKQKERLRMYAEMKRLSKGTVILHDYNSKRNGLISLVEGLEQGDYFNFIRQSPQELEAVFTQVKQIPVGEYASWYVCSAKS